VLGVAGSNPVVPTKGSDENQGFFITLMNRFMPFHVYILQSQKTFKYYCGQTDNLEQRLLRHNSGEVKSTKHGMPWVVVKYVETESRAASMNLERFIKARDIGRWLLENNQT
jgi:putative endonuclease